MSKGARDALVSLILIAQCKPEWQFLYVVQALSTFFLSILISLVKLFILDSTYLALAPFFVIYITIYYIKFYYYRESSMRLRIVGVQEN